MTHSTERPRRVLFVSYLFPPVGGVGVHRVTKFVKYLPQFGWNCSVLTVSNPSVPLVDGSLKKDIPACTNVYRARTWEPGYALKATVGSKDNGKRSLVRTLLSPVKRVLRSVANLALQPDSQILWRPNALKEGHKILADGKHDVIVATGPPFSSLLVGATLAEKSGLPLVLDYRDEWGISNAYWENKQHNWLSNRIQRRMQFSALRAASVILATTPSSARALQELAHEAGSNARVYCIYNGFDPDDFPTSAIPMARANYGHGANKCRISFVGTLWNLNPIEPFVEGALRFAATNPELASRLEIVLAGRRTPEQEAAIERLSETPCKVATLPFMAHNEAVRLMQDSDALLLINADLPDTNRIINAKTFEYMAARRPMFVVAPDGDLWDVVRDLPGTMLCQPGDPVRIATSLAELVRRHEAGKSWPREAWKIAAFERRSVAEDLAYRLDDVVRAAQGAQNSSQSRLASVTHPAARDSHVGNRTPVGAAP
jgi:glycosyltransferase involved in cell wall biosynthesis